jgi:hypothetical protein
LQFSTRSKTSWLVVLLVFTLVHAHLVAVCVLAFREHVSAWILADWCRAIKEEGGYALERLN